MRKYITKFNLEDNFFSIHRNDGKVKTIPFSKYNEKNIKKIIDVLTKEKDILKNTKRELKLLLLLNTILSFLIIGLSVIAYQLSSSSIIMKVLIIITGIDFSIINFIFIEMNCSDLERIKKSTIPSIDNQIEILKQDLLILDEKKKNTNVVSFIPYQKKKELTKNLNYDCPTNNFQEDTNEKIIVLKRK